MSLAAFGLCITLGQYWEEKAVIPPGSGPQKILGSDRVRLRQRFQQYPEGTDIWLTIAWLGCRPRLTSRNLENVAWMPLMWPQMWKNKKHNFSETVFNGKFSVTQVSPPKMCAYLSIEHPSPPNDYRTTVGIISWETLGDQELLPREQGPNREWPWFCFP